MNKSIFESCFASNRVEKIFQLIVIKINGISMTLIDDQECDLAGNQVTRLHICNISKYMNVNKIQKFSFSPVIFDTPPIKPLVSMFCKLRHLIKTSLPIMHLLSGHFQKKYFFRFNH
ncbi:hypothetical protein A3Q33_03910 [Colwellia sp. PAMC 21821]|nr:hypothetical protein A3Q33_03910 [Colwellia sp. PAMC 21821]